MPKATDDLNRKRLAEIQETAKAGYWEVDPVTGDFLCSEGACLIFGLEGSGEDLSLNNFLDRVHPDDQELVRKNHTGQTGCPGLFEISYRLLLPDNTEKYIYEKNYIDYDQEGKPALCRFIFQDLSIRKKIETPADTGHEFWKQLIDAIDDYILIMDTDLRVISVNRSTRNLLDKSLGEIIGKPCHELFYGSTLDCPCAAFCPAKEAATSKETRRREISNDYLQKVLMVTSTPYLDTNGDLLGYIQLCKDITERKMLETQVRQNEKMEAVGTLAGGIAHDFNNILGAIYGFTELALLDSQPDTGLRDDLYQIKNAANRAKDLISQLLTFSRETETNQQPIFLSPIIKETIKLLRSSLPANIKIYRDIDESREKVMADPARIHQVMMNLSANAAQAMTEKGGRIDISLKPADISEEESKRIYNLYPGKFLVLTMSDNGKGMEQEVIDRIFDPFFTTRQKGQGTGMGLTVVHGIVTDSNGVMNVESEPGKGTTFRIYFPVFDEETPKPDKPAIVNLPTGNEQILFVDDEAEIIIMAQKMLKYLGYGVTTFTDSREALEAFRTSPDDYDLLITDQIMPHLTGYELSRKVLEIRPDLPIILCTGHRAKISEEEMKKKGIRNILYKPLALQQLGNTIRNTIDGGVK